MSKGTKLRTKKILFASPNLSAGGAQRQTINIANGLHRRGYDVSVFLFYDEGELKSSLDKSIKIFSPSFVPILKKSKILWVGYGIIHFFKTALFERPDILYSRHWPKIPMAIIGRMLRFKTISGEGNNLKQTFSMERIPLRFYLRKFGVQLSNKVVANSQSLALETKEVFKLRSEVKTIYNGIDIQNVIERSKKEKNHKWFGTEIPLIIAVGSFKPQKGFSYLLQALEIVNRTKTVRLIIIGNGGEEKRASEFLRKTSNKRQNRFSKCSGKPFPVYSKS